jgi:flagellar basal body-associated protein FliL
MGKRLLAVFIVVAFVGAAGLVNLLGAAPAAQKAPDTFDIKSPLWPNPTKTPANFTHKKHTEDYKIACTECHHVYKDGKNVWKQGDPVQKCEACHNEPTITGEMKLPPDKQKLNLKIAFHKNCVTCHQDLKKKDPAKYAKIPVTCAQCHPVKK